jgi:hypothetical protein
MATRIALAAALDCTQAQFRKALGALQLQVQQTGRWHWTVFSLWAVFLDHVDEPKLKQGLAALPKRTLYITTEDDERWYLTVTAPGKSVLQSCREISHAQAVKKTKAFRQECSQLAKKLDDYGIGDQVNLARILSGDQIPANDWDEATGNLRHFLTEIGLAEVFSKEDYEVVDQEDGETETIEPEDYGTAIWEQVKSLRLSEVRGGPWKTTVDKIPLFRLLGWFCDTDGSVGLLIIPPKGKTVQLTPPKNARFTLTEHRGTFRLGLPWMPPGMVNTEMRHIVKLLAGLPSGTELELMTAAVTETDEEDPPLVEGNQRYRGILKGKTWQVTHSHPKLDVATLQEAMELCEWISDKGPLQVRNPAEAAEVVAMAKRTDWFGNDFPEAKGDKVYPRKASRAHVALMLFRHRFHDTWDTAAAQERDEEGHAEFEESLTDLGESINAMVGVQHSGVMVHQGIKGKFFQAEMKLLEDKVGGMLASLAAIFDEEDRQMLQSEGTLAERVKKIDDDMKRLGYAHFGDMLFEGGSDVIIRGYGKKGSDTYGVLMAGTMGQWEYEFYTRFSNGSSLTTSTTEGIDNDRARKIVRSSHPGVSVAGLHRKHRAGVKKLTKGKTQPVEAEPSLSAMAAAIDEFLMRQGRY